MHEHIAIDTCAKCAKSVSIAPEATVPSQSVAMVVGRCLRRPSYRPSDRPSEAQVRGPVAFTGLAVRAWRACVHRLKRAVGFDDDFDDFDDFDGFDGFDQGDVAGPVGLA